MYKKVTQPFCQVTQEDPQPLFLSHVKPHKPVTLQWLAHWIKDMLVEEGIDMKAHSVRGVSSSAALEERCTHQ